MYLLFVLLATLSTTVAGLNYACIVDAGSSGSRVYVFRWPDNPDFTDFMLRQDELLEEHNETRVRPGVSQFSGQSAGPALDAAVAAHLAPLIAFCEKEVPANQHSDTPFYLFATAGMRLVPVNSRQEIFLAVRRAIANTVFAFDDLYARVISGEEEAVYAWVAANTILKETPRTAVFELGGASLQVTFEPEFTPLSHLYELVIQEDRFRTYATSYLTWGADQASERWAAYLEENGVTENPCDFLNQPRQVGSVTTVGTGDFDACVSLLDAEMFHVDTYCPSGECTINGNYQPPLPAALPVTAVGGGWYFTSRDLGCTGDGVTLDCWRSKGLGYSARDWFGTTGGTTEWGAITQDNRDDIFFVENSFRAAYTYSALKAFKIDPSREVNMVNDLNDRSVTWTLGAMTYELGLWVGSNRQRTGSTYKIEVQNNVVGGCGAPAAGGWGGARTAAKKPKGMPRQM